MDLSRVLVSSMAVPAGLLAGIAPERPTLQTCIGVALSRA